MEVIRISGYTEDEKLNIAKSHLLQKQIERNGLKTHEIAIEDSAIIDIIRYSNGNPKAIVVVDQNYYSYAPYTAYK
jgi:ATP-dependent Lon protease